MAAGQAQVLRELDGGWLQCQDAQGVYYFNKVTQQSCDDVPPELRGNQQPAAAAAPQVQVLRELGGGWAQCQDEQGIFYFNQVTQQASVDVPPELRGAAQPAQPPPQYAQQAQMPQAAPAMEPKVKQKIGDWMICEDAQGEYYLNSRTGQTFDQPPAELVQLYQQTQQPQQPAAQQAKYTQPQQQSAQKIKQQLGDWLICEDAQGEFYFNSRTQQSFDQPPAELVQLYQSAQQQKQATPQQTYTQQVTAQQQQLMKQQQQQAQLQQMKQQQMQYQPMAQAQNQYATPSYSGIPQQQYSSAGTSASAMQYYQALQQQQQQRYR